MSKKTNFNVENIELIKEDPDSQFTTLEIHAFSSGLNKHDMICSEEVLRSTAETLYDKPILYNYAEMIGDFGTHTDPERSLIAGFVSPNSATFSRLSDGRLGLFVKAKLWKYYVPKVIDLLRMANGKKKVSVEMDLFSKVDETTGIEEMIDFKYSGVCILGDLIEEASPGAHLRVETFAKKNLEFKEAKEKEFGIYDGIDFKIPEDVKNAVKKGMELKNTHGKGGSAVILTIARHLMKSDSVSPEKIKLMNRYLARHKEMNLKDKESGDWISWNLLGGHSGFSWANEIVQKMNQKEEIEMKYFEKVTFPYTDKKDINPAIKGIDPQVSLSQANAIAKQSDAIGVSEEKNGWAIAIANFKKTHVVKDGKWVKKESMGMSADNDKSSEKEVVYMEEEKEFEKDMEQKEDMAEETSDSEKDEEINEEEKEEEVEEKEEEMSLDANVDVKAMLSFLEEETEDYKSMAEKYSDDSENKDFSAMVSYMVEKMKYMKDKMESLEKEKEDFASKMEEMSKNQETYMAENMELKQYKEEKEKEEFTFAVDTVLKDIEGKVKIPQGDLEELKTLAFEKYSIDTFDEWSNYSKAKAFSFALKENKEEKSEFLKFEWTRNTNSEKASKKNNPWEKKKE